MDNYEKTVQESKKLSSHEGDGHKVINHHSDYLKGSLYVVGFKTADGEERSNFVYIEGNDVTVCKNQALLNEMVARKSRKVGLSSLIEDFGGVAGIIGLMITVTIVYILINDPKAEVPQILSAALTTILGFYFGTKSSK